MPKKKKATGKREIIGEVTEEIVGDSIEDSFVDDEEIEKDGILCNRCKAVYQTSIIKKGNVKVCPECFAPEEWRS